MSTQPTRLQARLRKKVILSTSLPRLTILQQLDGKQKEASIPGTRLALGVPVCHVAAFVFPAPRSVAFYNVAAAVLLAHVARALVAVGLVPASLAVHRVLCAVAVPSGPTLARFGAIRRT